MNETIGWIGVGSIGHRMAAHVAAKHRMVVADAGSTAKAPKNAEIAASNGAVAQAVETIVLSLPDGAVTEAVCREIAAAPDRKVKTVIETSTIGIAAAEKANEILSAAGIEMVDAPVSGGIAGADKATLAIMLACGPETYTRLLPLMSLMGKPFHVGTTPGQGQTLKLLNNFLSATAMAATSEAVAFGTAQGLDMKTILDVVHVSSGQNTAISDKFPNRIINEAYNAGFTTKLQAKDVRLFFEAAKQTGTATRVGELVAGLWAEAEQAMPGSDITEMYLFTRDGVGKQRDAAE